MACKEFKPVSYVIFDLDGLLLDTEPIAKTIYTELADKYKKGPVSLDVQHKLLGRSEKDAILMFIQEMKLPIKFDLCKGIVNEMEDQRYGRTKMMLGASRLICHFTRHNVPMAIATSSRIELVDLKFSQYRGLYENIHHVVSGSSDEEVPRSKPDPTIFTVCASRFEPPADPECCLVFEDSPVGVAAACCAGMQVIMVPDPLLDKSLQTGATMVIKTLADFRPELFGIPPIPR